MWACNDHDQMNSHAAVPKSRSHGHLPRHRRVHATQWLSDYPATWASWARTHARCPTGAVQDPALPNSKMTRLETHCLLAASPPCAPVGFCYCYLVNPPFSVVPASMYLSQCEVFWYCCKNLLLSRNWFMPQPDCGSPGSVDHG